MAAKVQYREAPNAEQVVERLAAPALTVAARELAERIPEHVPVHQGVARRTYKTRGTRVELEGAHPQAQVLIRSPFWHFLEYGTRFNPPYRPVQRAVEAAGLRYTAS
jgi:hypothetical protein